MSDKSKYTEIEVPPGLPRRKFLGMMGASMALAGLTTTGCIRKPMESIYSDSKRPEDRLPGEAKSYSTTALVAGGVLGLSVSSMDGRPIKIDGNLSHPLSNPLGSFSKKAGSNAFSQAEILNLYDGDRGSFSTISGKKSDKESVLNEIKKTVRGSKSSNGKGIALVFSKYFSPSFYSQLTKFHEMYPQSICVELDTNYSSERVSGTSSFVGNQADVVYDLSKANVIFAADSDFLGVEGDSVKYARQFSEKRVLNDGHSSMNRLYSAESCFSLTGSNADHRMVVHSQRMGHFLLALAHELNVHSISIPQEILSIHQDVEFSASQVKWLKALAIDLAKAKSKSVVIVGDRQPGYVHALGLAINHALGAFDSNLVQITQVQTPSFVQNLSVLAEASQKNSIENLFIFGGNPVYSQPSDVEFSHIVHNAKSSFYLGYYLDETAKISTYYVPETHFLESWNDFLASDGSYSLGQPLIAPLFEDCAPPLEVLSYLIDDEPLTDHDIVKNHFLKIMNINSSDSSLWKSSLSEGFVKNISSIYLKKFHINHEFIQSSFKKLSLFPLPSVNALHVDFFLDRKVYDGRYANNSWLQELPDQIYKLVWDNALLMSPNTAKNLGLCAKPAPGSSDVDLVKLKFNGKSLEVAVWQVPGMPDFCVALSLGYGKTVGEVGKNSGFNANLIRTSASWFGGNATIEKTGRTYSLVSTQENETQTSGQKLSLERKPALRENTLDAFKSNPKFVLDLETIPPEEQKSFLFSYPKNPSLEKWARQQWGMTIDLTTCIGCNACTIACQAENNISVVGKEEVFKNREMHWIRIDRYFSGDIDNPENVHTAYQPLGCMHCENAPCEAVCPVSATVHSPDGLNDMSYNRCVGTRYCANNCPYKVRRYNFFNYSKIDDERNPLYAMQKNPNVTVRFRGVMEKCSYCVHKINAAKVVANKNSFEGLIPDGALTTACQDACPTNAIIFGDVADIKTMVSKSKNNPRNYSVLGELNTRPRTTFLAKIRNVNPELG